MNDIAYGGSTMKEESKGDFSMERGVTHTSVICDGKRFATHLLNGRKDYRKKKCISLPNNKKTRRNRRKNPPLRVMIYRLVK